MFIIIVLALNKKKYKYIKSIFLKKINLHQKKLIHYNKNFK